MHGKSSKEVLNALQQFIKDVPNVYSLTSDQDAACLTNDVLEFINSHNIRYRTTEDNNHYVIGIINRFMRTIRDFIGENRYIDENEMNNLIDAYNNSPHSSLNNKAPNDITEKDEQNYIQTKLIINPYDFKPEDKVSAVLGPNTLSKKQSRVNKETYLIDSKSGNLFLIRDKDDSVDKYPGYRLIKTRNNNIAETIKSGKRRAVDKIISYDEKKNKYKVQYERIICYGTSNKK